MQSKLVTVLKNYNMPQLDNYCISCLKFKYRHTKVSTNFL